MGNEILEVANVYFETIGTMETGLNLNADGVTAVRICNGCPSRVAGENTEIQIIRCFIHRETIV